MTSYPLVFAPGGKGIVFLESYLPPDLDPWIRWSFEGEVIARGLLSEGLDRTVVKVPETTGFYKLAVEMVPMAPVEGESWEFTSPLMAETLISVDGTGLAVKNSFGIPGFYYSLFHFEGEFSDWGVRSEPLELYFGNEPLLDVKQGVFGYRMEPFRSFMADGFLLPITEEGLLEPFSILLSFAMENTPESIKILETSSGDFDLSLTTDLFGVPVVKISDGNNELELSADSPLAPGVYSSMIVSVFPDYETGRLSLSLSSEADLKEIYTEEWMPGEIESGGSTVIGGNSGGVDVLDAVGVFYRDIFDRTATVPDIFRKTSEMNHENLFYAQGFDSPDLDGDLLAVSEYSTGSFNHHYGYLELTPDSSLTLPGFPYEEGIYNLEINISGDWDGEEDEAAVIFIQEETPEGIVKTGEIFFPAGNISTTLSVSPSEGLIILDEAVFNMNAASDEASGEEGDATLPDISEGENPENGIFLQLSGLNGRTMNIEDILILNEPVEEDNNLSLDFVSEL